MKEVLSLLSWKHERNDEDIDSVQVAKLLKIEMSEAEEVIELLYKRRYLIKWYSVKCPCCEHYTEVSEFEVEKKFSCSYFDCDYEFETYISKYKYEYCYKLNNAKFKKYSNLNNGITPFRIKEESGYMTEEKKIKVFLSYSHADEQYKNELDKHLAVQRKRGKIEIWNDRKIIAGKHIHDEIDNQLENADIIILLLSSDFFASDYCYSKEMKKALEMHEVGNNVIIPVIVRPCDWLDSPLKDIVALPEDGVPVSKWQDADEAYLNVVKGIKAAIDEM